VVLDRGKARAFTRNGYDWTDYYAPIKACEALRCRAAVIDGEIVALNALATGVLSQ
jgi:ATP-dependent DNA ligase